MNISFASERLGIHHRAAFSCGDQRLDDYFHRHAAQDERRQLGRTFVLLDLAAHAVAGYYTLAATSITPADLPSALTEKLPSYPQLPAILIGRLAVATVYQGQGVGRLLLADAVKRIAAVEAGVFLIVVDAYVSAQAFYARFGFVPFPGDPTRMYLPLKTARAAIV